MPPLDATRIVLVLEDDDLTRQVLRAILEYGGLRVIDTPHPADAVELCQTIQNPYVS